MATFFMFGKYTSQSLRDMSIERTQRAMDEIKRMGGEIRSMHALLGEYDLLFCVDLPGIDDAMKASVNLSKLTGISFTTSPAVSVEMFDRLVD